MSNELGEKLTCPECGAAFYSLNKNPAICPKCSYALAIEDATQEETSEGAEVIEISPFLDEEEAKKKQHIEECGDIDLTSFDEVDEIDHESHHSSLADIEDVNELEDHIESFSELEDREPEEDRINSDDADDDLVIEEMEELGTLVDKV